MLYREEDALVTMIRTIARTFLASCILLAVFETETLPDSEAQESPTPAARIMQPGAKQSESGMQTAPVNVQSGMTSGNLAYERVAAHLDTDGVLYLYWSAEKALGELDKKLASIRDVAVSDPGLAPEEKSSLQNYFDLGIRILLRSGLQGVKAFGLSSREIEPGLFINKTFTYFPDRSGFLWDSFAKPPHDFPFLNMVPENTGGFAFFDFNLTALWRAVSKELAATEIPSVAKWQQHFLQQVQAFIGLSLDELLGSLGDQAGIIVTLDPKATIQIPLGNEQCEMAEPAVALLWKVRNDQLFDRLDALFAMNPNVAKIDTPNVRMRVMRNVEEIPSLAPTMARYGDYLIISSSDKLVRQMLDTASGKTGGIKSSADFNTLAAGMAEKGNSVAYVAKRLQKTLGELQMKLSQVREKGNPLLDAISAKFSGLSADAATYTVGGATDDGWFTIGKTTKDVNDILGEILTLPAYYYAVAATEEIKQARTNDKLAKIKHNLADLRAAKDEAISEKNLQEGQMLNRQDIEEYVTKWPESVVGETYVVGTVGQEPYATAPVDLGEYPTGSKIEP
jgi:hypothetical protein